MEELTVEIYQDDHGKQPLVEWLYSLKDIRTQARIENRLRRISTGNLGDHKAVGAGVFELRLSFGPGYRVYFGRIGSVVILLLCGGDKGSQRRDIERAKTLLADYLEDSP